MGEEIWFFPRYFVILQRIVAFKEYVIEEKVFLYDTCIAASHFLRDVV